MTTAKKKQPEKKAPQYEGNTLRDAARAAYTKRQSELALGSDERLHQKRREALDAAELAAEIVNDTLLGFVFYPQAIRVNETFVPAISIEGRTLLVDTTEMLEGDGELHLVYENRSEVATFPVKRKKIVADLDEVLVALYPLLSFDSVPRIN